MMEPSVDVVDSSNLPPRGSDDNHDDPEDVLTLQGSGMVVAVRGLDATLDDAGRSEDAPLTRGHDDSDRRAASSTPGGDRGGPLPLVLAQPVAAADDDDDDEARGDFDDAHQVDELDANNDDQAKAAAEAAKVEQLRQRLLANATEAVVVVVVPAPAMDEQDDSKSLSTLRSKRKIVLLAVLSTSVVIGVVVGTAAPLTKQRISIGTPTPAPVQATTGGFSGTIHAETLQNDGVFFGNPTDKTTGSVELINCAIKGCDLNVTNCVTAREYEAGCCMGGDCPIASKCGDVCPPPPESCYPTDPHNTSCTRSECYTCNKVHGEDVYQLSDFIFGIECLQGGTAIRESNQQIYKWVIICGPVVAGPFDEGEYLCVAARQGADYTDDSGGILTYYLSCQYLALSECKCGPPDMDTYGLPAPNETCSLNGTCPYRCDDSGPDGVWAICKKFPGNVSWWEGQNADNRSWFLEGLTGPNFEFDIFIKGQN